MIGNFDWVSYLSSKCLDCVLVMGVGDAYFLGRTSKIKIDQAAFSRVYYGIMNICNIYLKSAPIPCVEAQ